MNKFYFSYFCHISASHRKKISTNVSIISTDITWKNNHRTLRYYTFFCILFIFGFNQNLFSQVNFTTPGTYTWTVPPCVTSVTVQVWGGGGGGGGAIAIMRNSSSEEACAGAGGGGGGGYSSKTYAVIPGQTYTIIVGDAGTSGSSGSGTWNGGITVQPSAGGTGGTSSFSGNSYYLQATGGNGGNPAAIYNDGSNDPNDFNNAGTAGSGGVGSGGTVNYSGGNGAPGLLLTLSTDKSGGGGGAAGPGGNGGNAAAPGSVGPTTDPPGGTGQAPGGAGGNGKYDNLPSNVSKNGGVGSVIGGAGGGALVHRENYGVQTATGGSGARGEVRLIFTANTTGTPTFAQVGPYCSGAAIPPLPTTSINNISGTWSPSIDNFNTTTYTFTPDAAQCADVVTMTIVINPGTTPAFTALGPYCIGATPGTLPTTSSNGITGTWSPSTISTSATGTTTYTFTPAAGQCANITSMTVTINNNITPTFTALGPYCVGAAPGALPTTSSNGITGTWSPSTINTSATGNTTYTFTPAAGQCASVTTMIVSVNNSITPTFTALGPYCVGATPGALPTISDNGITGTWSPAAINTSSLGTTVYTFTPAAGQCGTTATMSVTIASSITPTFNPLGPYCVGDNPGILPATSNNGINGTWNPATINTASAGTTVYTFTPAGGQCGVSTTMSVIVGTDILPLFSQPGPYCLGDIPGMLPSTSNNGISGTWDPSAISTSAAGTTVYTFTPAPGQCAVSATMPVVVNAVNTPVFEQLGPYCTGEAPEILPSVSTNGITGTWSPPSITTANPGNFSYQFTPTSGQCSSGTSMIINVISNAITATASPQQICAGQSTTLTVSGSGNFIWVPGNMTGAQVVVAPATTTTYTVNGGISNCTSSAMVTIDVDPAVAVSFTADVFSGCEDLLVQFTDLSNADSVSWYWDFGDNSFSYEQNPQHIYYDPGIYDVFLVITTGNGCVYEHHWDSMIAVYRMPIAEFVFTPETVSELDPMVWFFDRSIDATAWNWNFGEDYSMENNSSYPNPVHEYTDTGQYIITLVAFSEQGCTDTAIHRIYVEPNVTIYVPNAFTPNEDEKNPNFISKGEGIKWDTYEMRIFDRWGKQLLYTRDYEHGWNGEYQGKQVPEGVYIWIISFIDVNNKRYDLKGIVTLIK